MSNNLRWLIWSAILLGITTVIFGWNDELDKLAPEIKRIEKIQTMEKNSILNMNWSSINNDLSIIQIEWLDRLEKIENPSAFRAKSMENIGEICQRFKANCNISSQGEVLIARKNEQDEIDGLIQSKFRVSLPLQNSNFQKIIAHIENDKKLKKIDRFTVRGDRANFILTYYGLNDKQWDLLRNSAIDSIKPDVNRSETSVQYDNLPIVLY